VARTATARLAPVALAAVLACSGDAGGPPSGGARIDYVDGALEPLLVPGEPVVVEGFSFGIAPGTVRFTRAGGGEIDATVTPEDWGDHSVTVVVPDDAASGPVALRTAGGSGVTAAVRVLPAAAFDPGGLAWRPRSQFPGPPVGVALAVAEFAATSGATATLYAAGGAEPVGPSLVPDSGIFVARVTADGTPSAWARQHDDPDPVRHRNLPAPRAFAATAIATRHNSRFAGTALYVIGGIDASGRPQASVFTADATADSVVGRFVSIEPLPAPVAGAIAVVRRGRIYVMGGVDPLGRPGRRVFVGRIGADGHIDGWYAQPELPAPRAYGGGVVLDRRVVVFGGVEDSVPLGGGLDATPSRLVTSDTAPISLASGFFRGAWTPGTALLSVGRSQFATLPLGNVVLAVGGMYAGAAADAAETLAAGVTGDVVAPFAVVATTATATIHGQGGGTVVGAAGAAWRGPDGRYHGLVLGGMDLQTRQRTAKGWGF